jgi:lipoate-protein ligase A
LGIHARLDGTSNLATGEHKFSGNSANVHKNRALHHGTILFNSDLDRLNEFLLPGHAQYEGTAIPSKRASVVNLSGMLDPSMNLKEFRRLFVEFILSRTSGSTEGNINDSDRESIIGLAENKYSSWEWNFGWSPDYSLASLYRDNSSEWLLELSVSKGIIHQASITEVENGETNDHFSNALRGLRHRWSEVKPALENINFGQYLGIQGVNNLIHYLF